jgi:hypothetical protein
MVKEYVWKIQSTFFIALCPELEYETSAPDGELIQYFALQPSIDFFLGTTFNRKNAKIITEWNYYYRSQFSIYHAKC